MPTIALFAMMLFFTLSRVYLPFGTKSPGKLVKAIYLSLPERSLMQRVNIYAIGFVLLLMSLTGAVNPPVEIAVVLITLAIMAIPVRCLIFAQGVGLNNVVYRPWSDFVGFSVAARRIVLLGREGTRPLNLPLLAGHQKEVLPILRSHLPEVKAGKEARGGKRAIAG